MLDSLNCHCKSLSTQTERERERWEYVSRNESIGSAVGKRVREHKRDGIFDGKQHKLWNKKETVSDLFIFLSLTFGSYFYL